MSKFCFFTDPSLLNAQTDQQAFGYGVASGGTDQFRITDLHTSSSTDVPAFAVCDGILCAQEDAQGTLTLILKPSETPPFESPVVSYFLYKGVAKSSLLSVSDGNLLDEDASEATDFTTRIAKEWKKQNGDDLTGSRAALGLDRDATFLHDDGTSQTNIFTDNHPIDQLFTYPHKTAQLPTVAAGDLIGSFESSFGFEVVLQRLGYKPKLAFARSADNQISVTSLADDNSGVPWLPDDYSFFAHWHEKEQVLAFIDPCAFFGSFVQAKLYKKSGTSFSKVKGSDIYQEILQKFANRNIAWLDLRNNYSYSYNLFGLYDDTVRFVSHSDASQTNDIDFRSGSWPILKLQIADVPGSKRKSLHRTKLCLPVGLSTAPAVLISKGFVTTLGPERPNFKAPAIAADSAEPAFYLPIRLAFPVTTDAVPVFLCSYTRVNIYEKPHAGRPAAGTLDIAGSDYLDGVFRPRDLQFGVQFADRSLRYEIYADEILVDLENQSGPTYASSVGVAEDQTSVTLFAFPREFLPNDNELTGQALPAWANAEASDNTTFLTAITKAFNSTVISKMTISPTPPLGTSPTAVDTILIENRPDHTSNAIIERSSINDFCIVILRKADFESLLSSLAGNSNLEPALPIFLTISASQTKQDLGSGAVYIEKILQASGFSRSQTGKAVLAHVATNQGVYQSANL